MLKTIRQIPHSKTHSYGQVAITAHQLLFWWTVRESNPQP
ncbi:MAG TPA: hypothetical protein DCM26_02955, partial [Desulfotomaculum sp.]|nr:hypothetical protein [Desulfotomaculum sp.]